MTQRDYVGPVLEPTEFYLANKGSLSDFLKGLVGPYIETAKSQLDLPMTQNPNTTLRYVQGAVAGIVIPTAIGLTAIVLALNILDTPSLDVSPPASVSIENYPASQP